MTFQNRKFRNRIDFGSQRQTLRDGILEQKKLRQQNDFLEVIKNKTKKHYRNSVIERLE